MLVLSPVSVPVASAVAAWQDNARVLLVAKVAVFPSSVVFVLVLGNSVRAWEIFALVLYIPWLLCWCGHFAASACPALKASPAVAGLAYFHCSSHPLWCLRGVVFSELVHSYAVVYASFLSTSACPAAALVALVGQQPFPLCSQCFSCAGCLADGRWGPHHV